MAVFCQHRCGFENASDRRRRRRTEAKAKAGVAHGGSLSYYLAAPAAALLVQLPSSKQLPEVREE